MPYPYEIVLTPFSRSRDCVVRGWSLDARLSHAEVRLASPFTSHVVLQREMKVPVWGTAAASEEAIVGFAGQKKAAKAAANANGATNEAAEVSVEMALVKQKDYGHHPSMIMFKTGPGRCGGINRFLVFGTRGP